MSLSFRAEITSNDPISLEHLILKFKPLAETPGPKPGQFYMVEAGNTKDPLLKRPFSAFGYENGNIKLLYRVRGKGTHLMKEMKPGHVVDVVGPLGNRYPEPQKGHAPLVIAGGVGIASLFPFIEELRGKAVVLYGGRHKDELVLLDEVEGISKSLYTSTDDGSSGKKGTVISLLSELPSAEYVIYSCGPKGMIKAVKDYALSNNIPGYASLEENMACGMGACLGCVVKTDRGYKRVCKEGPVFNLADILI